MAQTRGQTWDILVFVYFLSQQQLIRPLGYCAPLMYRKKCSMLFRDSCIKCFSNLKRFFLFVSRESWHRVKNIIKVIQTFSFVWSNKLRKVLRCISAAPKLDRHLRDEPSKYNRQQGHWWWWSGEVVALGGRGPGFETLWRPTFFSFEKIVRSSPWTPGLSILIASKCVNRLFFHLLILSCLFKFVSPTVLLIPQFSHRWRG